MGYRCDRDDAAVVVVLLGQRESSVVGGRSDRDDNTACKLDFCHEYFFISSCLYSLPVSVRGNCASNEMDRGHL